MAIGNTPSPKGSASGGGTSTGSGTGSATAFPSTAAQRRQMMNTLTQQSYMTSNAVTPNASTPANVLAARSAHQQAISNLQNAISNIPYAASQAQAQSDFNQAYQQYQKTQAAFQNALKAQQQQPPQKAAQPKAATATQAQKATPAATTQQQPAQPAAAQKAQQQVDKTYQTYAKSLSGNALTQFQNKVKRANDAVSDFNNTNNMADKHSALSRILSPTLEISQKAVKKVLGSSAGLFNYGTGSIDKDWFRLDLDLEDGSWNSVSASKADRPVFVKIAKSMKRQMSLYGLKNVDFALNESNGRVTGIQVYYNLQNLKNPTRKIQTV